MKRTLAIILIIGLLVHAGCRKNEPARPDGGPGDDPQPSPNQKSPAEAELEKLQGDWYVAAVEKKGLEVDETRGQVFTLKGDQFTTKDPRGNVLNAGTCKVNPSGTPWKIDFAYTEGDWKGTTSQAIYALEDDVLRLCQAPPGYERPSRFASHPESEFFHVVLTRKKVVPAEYQHALVEMGKLSGTWIVVGVEEQGRKVDQGMGRQFIFIEGQFNVRDPEGKLLSSGTLKVEVTPRLKALDLLPRDGAQETKPSLLIYSFGDDHLKICMAPPGSERPKEFVTKAGSGNSLLFLKREEAVKDAADLEKLHGTWTVESAEEKGKPVEEYKGRLFIFFDNTLIIRDAKGANLGTGTCKPVREGEIRKMDIHYKEGQLADQTGRLIYSLDGDSLQICLAPPNGERPEQFATRPDSEGSLLVLKRKKP